jgi:hypothetical protein
MASESDDRAKDMRHQDVASMRRKDIPTLVQQLQVQHPFLHEPAVHRDLRFLSNHDAGDLRMVHLKPFVQEGPHPPPIRRRFCYEFCPTLVISSLL